MMQSIESGGVRGMPTESPPPRALPYFTSNTTNITSPPFLRVSVASESGSHDYDDGDGLSGSGGGGSSGSGGGRGGGSNSPPDSSTRPTFPGSSGSTASTKPKRKRSMIACKNCNERRVRCDGATNGLPCSNCKHAGKTDCQFIESKRVRGARGRFESRDGMIGSCNSSSPTVSSKCSLTPSSSGAGTAPRRARRHSITGTDGEEWRRLLQNSQSVNRSTTGPVTYLGESWHLSWVVQEQLPTDEKPLHMPTLMMEDDGDIHNRVNEELWQKGAYVLPRYEVRNLLISQYFDVCHPTYPIVCKKTFLHSLQTNTFSHQLVQAILMVAATHCDWAILQRAGYLSRREAIEGFYKRTRALWDGDVEPDKITNIQTMFLMQFWWRAVTDHKDPLWWLTGAIRLAQSMGLHRSAGRSRLNDRDKRIWRRLWWLLFLRDRQAASHFGKPMMINEQDCDVEELEAGDLETEVDRVQTLSLLEHVKLAKLVGAITSCEFSPGAARDLQERMQLRDSCHHRLSEWQQSLPKELVYQSNSKNLYAMCLQIAFLAQLLLLNRPVIYTDHTLPETIRKPSETIAGNAADAITKISDDLVKTWGARYMTQHSMSCLFAAMTVQMIKRRSADPRAAADADRKLRQNMTNLVPLDKILPMAGWIHRRYCRILEREGEADEARNISISPPAMETAMNLNVPAILASQRTPLPPLPPPPPPPLLPPLPPQMKTIAEEDSSVRDQQLQSEQDDDWDNDCGQLLHLEQSLTIPSALLEHHLGTNEGGGNGGFPQNQHQHQQQHRGDEFGSLMTGNSDAIIVQPEIFDYHWFMENIGDLGDPFWWNSQEK